MAKKSSFVLVRATVPEIVPVLRKYAAEFGGNGALEKLCRLFGELDPSSRQLGNRDLLSLDTINQGLIAAEKLRLIELDRHIVEATGTLGTATAAVLAAVSDAGSKKGAKALAKAAEAAQEVQLVLEALQAERVRIEVQIARLKGKAPADEQTEQAQS